MARIAGVDLPREKRVEIGLTYVYGIGHSSACLLYTSIKEQLIFPEIEYDKVDKIRGMDIVFVTTAKTDEEARELLRLFGMPFAK